MTQAQLKRWFVVTFATANTVLLARTLRSPLRIPRLARLGGVVSHGAPLTFFGLLYARRRGRTSTDLPLLRGATAAGALATLTGGERRASRASAAALAGVVGTELYTRWYSRLGRTESVDLAAGGRLPDDLAFVELDGHRITIADLRGRPVALFFYRGNWCPLCMAQVREMAARWRELEELGVDVALISPQSDEQTRDLAERFEVSFRYLTDPDMTSARRLGLVHESGVPLGIPGYDPDTVFPTVLVLDADGTIVFSDQTDNYRVRPEPDTILAALRGAGTRAAA
ncbi:MAG: peroxiredoxin family protein [Candidatus Nanopelagicales bacterium]